MKKTSIFLMSALVLGLVACDDKSDLGIIQENPQEPMFQANGISLAFPESLQGETLDLSEYEEAGKVPVITLESAENLPEGAKLSYVMQVSNTEDFAMASKINVVDGAVSVEEWNEACKALYGNFTAVCDEWIRFAVYADINGQMNRLGGEDFYYAEKKITVTALPVDVPQYLYTPGNSNGWGFGSDNMRLGTTEYPKYWGYVYLDGEFKFTGQADWSPIDLGGGEEEGKLVASGANLNVGTGFFWVTVNLEELTWSATPVSNIGVIGDFTESQWGKQFNLTPSADYRVWTGNVIMSGNPEFKFRSDDNWDINLGGSMDNLVFNGANLQLSEPGIYAITLDLSTMPYKCTAVKI